MPMVSAPATSLLDLEDLECFITLAECEHFGRAAERLGVTVSAVSKRCARLESALGLRLFSRSSRSVTLTQAGAVLVDPARRVLAEADQFLEIAHDAGEGRLGELVIAYSPGNGPVVSEIIRSFRKRHPDVTYRLDQVLSRDMQATMQTGRACIGVCRTVRPSGFRSLVVSQTPVDHLAMSVDHPLAALDEISWTDLAGQTLLASDMRAEPSGTGLPEYLEARGASIRYEPWVSETQILDTIAASSCVTFVTKFLLKHHPRCDVVVRPFEGGSALEPITNYMVWRVDETSPVVLQFVTAAADMLSEHDPSAIS